MDSVGFKAFLRRPKDWKAESVELGENELRIRLIGRETIPSYLVLRGIIAFRDRGLIGAATVRCVFEEKGSYKRIEFTGPKGRALFSGTFMECRFE